MASVELVATSSVLPSASARATMEARITSALADMRQKVRGRLRGAARARFLACYEAALREAEAS